MQKEMNPAPLVSIITPSYNQGEFIRETIESVLRQDYNNIEYIIVDGMSTDNSMDIIQEYKDKLIIICERDNGQSDAINKGFQMAHGEIVAWLNSDDIYEDNCISRVVQEFIQNKELGLLYGDGYIIDRLGRKVRLFEHTQEFDYWKLVNFWDYIMQPAAFFRSDILKKAGYLDAGLHYCMDWDLWIRLAAISEVKYIPQPLACSREYEETKTSTGGAKRLEEIICLLQKYSGKRKPLGIVSYRASTFYLKYAKSILPVRKFAGLFLMYKHKWLFRKIPFKDAEGWIGKEYSCVVPEYVKNVKFEVEIGIPKLLPQKVQLLVDQKKVCVYEINQCGRNVIEISVNGKGIKEITLKCKKTARKNKKRIAMKINAIRFENKNIN